MKELETRYLERLSDLYPTIAAASTEIINLQAILNLPKGTEHFLTDIHGEWEAKQNRGCIWIYAWEAGKAGAGYFDLLSKREDRAGKADREAYGRLV